MLPLRSQLLLEKLRVECEVEQTYLRSVYSYERSGLKPVGRR